MLFKSWKARYFVLDNGYLMYYEKKLPMNVAPYGSFKKGELCLANATVKDYGENSSKIKIYGDVKVHEYNLNLECTNAEDALDWTSAIESHIIYANSLRFTIVGNFDEDKNQNNVEVVDQSYSIIPMPGFVVKVKSNDEKIFINICSHGDIPNLYSNSSGTGATNPDKWPYMISSPMREEIDSEKSKNGGIDSITIYDVIMNPTVVIACMSGDDFRDIRAAVIYIYIYIYTYY